MTTAHARRLRLRSLPGTARRSGGEGRGLPGAPVETWSGKAARALRKRLGATQEEFARVLGVATSSVHRWEAGRVRPDRRTGERLASLDVILNRLDKHFRAEGRVQFFTMPQARLDGDRPMDLLGLPSAVKRIDGLIKSILAGDFS